MKKHKIKHIIIVIMLIPILLISLSYVNYTKNNVKEDCSYYEDNEIVEYLKIEN